MVQFVTHRSVTFQRETSRLNFYPFMDWGSINQCCYHCDCALTTVLSELWLCSNNHDCAVTTVTVLSQLCLYYHNRDCAFTLFCDCAVTAVTVLLQPWLYSVLLQLWLSSHNWRLCCHICDNALTTVNVLSQWWLSSNNHDSALTIVTVQENRHSNIILVVQIVMF